MRVYMYLRTLQDTYSEQVFSGHQWTAAAFPQAPPPPRRNIHRIEQGSRAPEIATIVSAMRTTNKTIERRTRFCAIDGFRPVNLLMDETTPTQLHMYTWIHNADDFCLVSHY